MGRYVERYWPPGSTPRDGGEPYDAYVPHPISGWVPILTPQAERRLNAAEDDLRAATAEVRSSGGNYQWATDALVVQGESLTSSAIEGIYSSLQGLTAPPGRQNAVDRSVAGNWEMLEMAVAMGQQFQPVVLADLLALHDVLMSRSETPGIAGRIRQGPIWVGGSQMPGMGPLGARYVPPPSEMVPALLDDLLAAINSADLPPLLKAALAHVQFESIHPFADGNGRLGRALILVVLGREGLGSGMALPVSSLLLEERDDYYRDLLRYQRFTGDIDDQGRSAVLEPFLLLMSDCAHQAAKLTREVHAEVKVLLDKWAHQLADVRRDSSVWIVLDEVLRTPVCTAHSLSSSTQLSRKTCSRALSSLHKRGIVRRDGNPRAPTYTAHEVMAIAEQVMKVRTGSRNLKGLPRNTANPAGNSIEPSKANKIRRRQQGLNIRCSFIGRRSKVQCILKAGHKGHHRYRR